MKKEQKFDDWGFLAAVLGGIALLALEEWLWAEQRLYIAAFNRFAPVDLRLVASLQVVFSLFLVIFFLWASFNSRWKPVYFFLFAATIIVQYSYGQTLDRFLTVRDLYTALASPATLWLSSTTFLSLASLPPILMYGLLLWYVPTKYQTGLGVLTAVILISLLGSALVFAWDERHLHTNYGNEYFSRSPALSLPALAKTAVATLLSEAQTARLEREQLSHTSPTPPQNNLVYIIDESLRGDHLSVNGYHRPTTPYLEQLATQGVLTNWGVASAAATGSLLSNRVLLSGITQLPDPNHLHEQYPTLFQYAKAMGYTTHYFDTQTAHLWNTLSVHDLSYIDNWVNTDEFGAIDMHSDFRAAEQIQAITSQSTGNFILLNKTGIHFHYDEKYPPEEAVWTPLPAPGVYEDSLLVTNSYDNAILYNSEGFWRRLIPDSQDLDKTVYLYTADHGETLLENGEKLLHGGNSQQEARVPLFLIQHEPLLVDTTYQATHFNLFATALDLMAFPETERPHPYALSLLTATAEDSQPRYFLGGTNEHILFEDDGTESP